MRVHDEAEWQLQKAAFAADPAPEADKLLNFTVAWAELAEETLATAEREAFGLEPIDALNATLRQAEERTEHLTIGFVGQALLLLCAYWAVITDREAFYASLSAIEQNLFADAKTLWEISQAIKAAPNG